MIPNINMWVNPQTRKLVITFRFDIDKLLAILTPKLPKEGGKDAS